MRWPSFCTRVMPPGSIAVTLPLGPSTRTVLPFSLTVYLTPAGMGIGFLPIRDIKIPFCLRVPRTASADSFHCSLWRLSAYLVPGLMPFLLLSYRTEVQPYKETKPSGKLQPALVQAVAITRLHRESHRPRLRDVPGGLS